MEALEQAIEIITAFALSILRTIELRDIIDIAILSFAFYKLLWMIRTTSSGRVLRGVIILLVGLYLSSILRLYAISFLLSTAVEWGACDVGGTLPAGNPQIFRENGKQPFRHQPLYPQ